MRSREPGDAEIPAGELFDRWRAHHEKVPEPPVRGEPRAPQHAAQPADIASRRRGSHPLRTTDQVAAGREVVEALGLTVSSDTDPDAGFEVATATEPDAPKPVRRQPSPVGRSTDVDFAPRRGSRRVLALLLFATLGATGLTAYTAYDNPTTLNVGLAGVLLVVTLVLYGVRAGSSPTRLAIRAGQLEIVRGNHRDVFDLSSRYTRVQTIGTPGRRGWKVLMGRFGRDPFVIDASLVDPLRFTEAIKRFRPDE